MAFIGGEEYLIKEITSLLKRNIDEVNIVKNSTEMLLDDMKKSSMRIWRDYKVSISNLINDYNNVMTSLLQLRNHLRDFSERESVMVYVERLEQLLKAFELIIKNKQEQLESCEKTHSEMSVGCCVPGPHDWYAVLSSDKDDMQNTFNSIIEFLNELLNVMQQTMTSVVYAAPDSGGLKFFDEKPSKANYPYNFAESKEKDNCNQDKPVMHTVYASPFVFDEKIPVHPSDKYRGCLIGGAAGDALGYSVEFFDAATIFEKYGEQGITEYKLVNGVAEISDDTQMTLFTANGLLYGKTRFMMGGPLCREVWNISRAYRDWLSTQIEKFPLENHNFDTNHFSWLLNIPELFSRRAPGSTCMSALQSKEEGTIENPINNSKGCGSVMRVAPIGLYFKDDNYSIDKIDMIGAEVGALTHGHELGYIPAAALVHIINLVSHNDDIKLLEAVKDAVYAMPRLFPKAKHMNEFVSLMENAIRLSESDLDDLDAIRQLGEGWVAEETLAIAVYCALKYSNNFEKALIASVNHDGDSDSTGAVTGNILGAYLGMSNIPEKFINNLELKDVILEIADDLYSDCQICECSDYEDPVWERKYIYCNYDSERNLDTTYLECERGIHAFEVVEEYTGGTSYVCKRCGKVKHTSTLLYPDFETYEEPKKRDESEYVVLDQEKTLWLFKDTIELTIESTGQLFNLKKAQFEAGRGSTCELMLDESLYKISRNHATFYYENEAWYIKGNSINGTWLNGTRLEPNKKYLLFADDVIDFAHSEKVTFFKSDNQYGVNSKENLVGKTICGKYSVLLNISTGANYDTYLVLDKEKNCQYILKVCDKLSKGYRPELHEMMWCEAHALKELNHPAIPNFIDAIETDRYIFVIREYIEGTTLSELMENDGPQPLEKVIHWAIQLCDVLQYLHNCTPPYLYRDMKPENIILEPTDNIKLIDFGTVIKYGSDNKNANFFFGTVGYAAPERFSTSVKEDTRVDIYSLGMTIRYLVTGENPKLVPYTGTPIRKINPELPEQLEMIIGKCIEPNPDNRYQSCNELLLALEGKADEKKTGLLARIFGKALKEHRVNFTVGEIFFGMNQLLREKIFYGGLESAESILLTLTKAVFGCVDEKKINLCFQIYLQTWNHCREGMDVRCTTPTYIKQALCEKFSSINADVVIKCVDLALTEIYRHEPQLKHRADTIVALQKSKIANVEKNK